MNAVHVIIAILLNIHGGTVQCPPTPLPSCTVFVSSVLAIDVIQTTPGGEIVILRWDPSRFVIGE